MMLRICVGCALLLVANFVEGADEIPANLIAGKKFSANARLKKGDKVVGWYEKKAYLVEVLEVKPNNRLRIMWVEGKEEVDDVRPDELYTFGDSSETRKSRATALPEAYRTLDKNGDGQIGLFEWDRAKYAQFRALDKNSDGLLTPKELAGKEPAVPVATTAPVATTTPAVATASTTPSTKEAAAKDKPAPVNLVEYSDKVGQTFTFALTGKAKGGDVWGDATYAMNSNLAATAVHAGVLKDGAAGQVTVSITINPVDKFTGSTMNGVTSMERNEAGPGFTIK